MEWLLKQGTAPEVIPCGGKLMSIHLKSVDVRVIDSLNFFPMALSKLPGCFGFTELRKGYFPHLFNTRENQTYIGPLPDSQFYSPEIMSTAGRSAFLTWYEEEKQKGENFDFQKEMYSYCR